MKWLLWVLLLGNILFFALMQWGIPLLGIAPSHQPSFHAEKIRLLAASSVAQDSLATSSVVTVAPQSQPSSTALCLEWGEFSGADLLRADAALSTLNLKTKLMQRQVEYASGYWVYIPPPKTRTDAEKKIALLNSRGVDNFIMQEAGKWHNAISLGLFKTEEAAHKFVENLKAKRIKTALVGERMSKLKFTIFVLSGLDAAENAKIKALQNDFFGSELKEMPCHPVSVKPVAASSLLVS